MLSIDEVIEDLKYDIEIDMYIHDIAPQIVEWLEELKELRELKSKLNINSQYRLYRIWQMMRQRCNNENAENYKYYGGRGICVCDEWGNDFSLFALWSFANGYNDNLTIDRIESDGNYEPSNCRWISKKEQMNNRSSNTKYTYDGETHTLSEWADIYKINKGTFYTRWSNGKRGTELFAPAKIKKENRKPVEYNGKTQTIRQWAEEYNGGWISVKDRLPNDDKEQYIVQKTNGFIDILGFTKDAYKLDRYDFAEYRGKKKQLFYDYNSEYGYIECECEAWQYLPEQFKERD